MNVDGWGGVGWLGGSTPSLTRVSPALKRSTSTTLRACVCVCVRTLSRCAAAIFIMMDVMAGCASGRPASKRSAIAAGTHHMVSSIGASFNTKSQVHRQTNRSPLQPRTPKSKATHRPGTPRWPRRGPPGGGSTPRGALGPGAPPGSVRGGLTFVCLSCY